MSPRGVTQLRKQQTMFQINQSLVNRIFQSKTMFTTSYFSQKKAESINHPLKWIYSHSKKALVSPRCFMFIQSSTSPAETVLVPVTGTSDLFTNCPSFPLVFREEVWDYLTRIQMWEFSTKNIKTQQQRIIFLTYYVPQFLCLVEFSIIFNLFSTFIQTKCSTPRS